MMMIVAGHYGRRNGSRFGNHRQLTVIELSSRCSISVDRLLISGVVAKPLSTTCTDDEDRRFAAGPEPSAPGSGRLQRAVLPASSSPVRCACGLRDSRLDNHARAAGDGAPSTGA